MRVQKLAASIALMSCTACLGVQAGNIAAVANKPAPEISKLVVSVDTAGVAKTTHTNVIPGLPNHSDEPPFMNGEPEHLRVTFDNDKLSDYTDYLQRQLLIYPVQSYAHLFHGKEKAAFDKVIPELKRIIATKSDRNVKAIPILPSAEAFEVFHNQVKYLNFKQGTGIAFLTCYAQDEAPIKNGDFFYTFQGLTNDGKYYVCLFCPVQDKKLPDNAAWKKTAEYLGKLPGAEFTPNLTAVDHMIESMSIK